VALLGDAEGRGRALCRGDHQPVQPLEAEALPGRPAKPGEAIGEPSKPPAGRPGQEARPITPGRPR
jgi:hypothetical protein